MILSLQPAAFGQPRLFLAAALLISSAAKSIKPPGNYQLARRVLAGMPRPCLCYALCAVLAGASSSAAIAEVPTLQTSLTAEAIMARVAVNQDRAETERAHSVYLEHSSVQSRKGGTLRCGEVTEVRVTPMPKGEGRHLLTLSGHVRDGSRMVHYTAVPRGELATQPASDGDAPYNHNIGDKVIVLDADSNGAPVRVPGFDIDMVESMRRSFTSDKESKDGVQAGLFPLTTEQQKAMLFELKGREAKNGRNTFHITFRPRDKGSYGWKGDAWIDDEAFEPVVVRTALSRSLPLGVRMLLGTNLPGLGFTVVYAPHAAAQEAVWFPASFGTEFKVRVLFAFRRDLVISIENRSFERTHVNSTMYSDTTQPAEPSPQP